MFEGVLTEWQGHILLKNGFSYFLNIYFSGDSYVGFGASVVGFGASVVGFGAANVGFGAADSEDGVLRSE